MQKILTIIGFSAIMAMMAALPVSANSGTFTIYPSYMHGDNSSWIIRDIEQGSAVMEYVTVENLTEEPQLLQLEVKGAVEEGDSFVIDDLATDSEINAWIVLSQKSVTLEPKQKLKIPLEITVPEDADLRTYSGAILASQAVPSGENLNIVTRIGVRMYISAVSPQPYHVNIFSSVAYVNAAFFTLSLFGLISAIFYTVTNYLDQRKYEKKHA